MGTFSITTPTAIASKSGAVILRDSNDGTTDADLILAVVAADFAIDDLFWGQRIITDAAVSGTIRFDFDQNSNIISLDGAPPISFNNLPSGFLATSASLSFMAQIAVSASIFLQLDNNTESPAFSTPGVVFPASITYNFSRLPWPTMLDIINNGFGIRVAFSIPADFIAINDFQLTGEWEIQRFMFDNVIIQDTTNVEAGDKVQIDLIPTSPNPVVPDIPLSSVVAILLVYTDAHSVVNTITILAQDFWVWNYYQIIFYMPRFRTPTGPISVYAVGNGTQFSGSVLLGTMTVVFADASGIYVLIPGKTTDTIYDPSRDGTTYEANIPDPLIKSGYVP